MLQHSSYLGSTLRTPEQVLAQSLAEAHRRLQVDGLAEHMDGRRGIVRAILAKDMEILVEIEMPDGRKIPDHAGYWIGRSAL